MRDLRRIEIVGGGPAGLYAATLLKRLAPQARVRVSEQNPRGATFGFGVVFSDRALDFLAKDDPETHDLIVPRMERWQDMVLRHPEGRVTLDGVGFAAIGRLDLINILASRAESEGAELCFGVPWDGDEGDLVIGADGLNSSVRTSAPDIFGETLDHFDNRFAWFGADRPFDALTQTFVGHPKGALNAHHYRFEPNRSTFIVECDAKAFDLHGFAAMSEEESARVCEGIFAETLDGAKLITNRSVWRRFPKLWCDRWVAGRRVILGDAAHTAHFSIGSGTRLALEDVVSLARSLRDHEDVDSALATWETERKPMARKIVDAANTSALWYDSFEDHLDAHPLDFARSYLSRSGRMDAERMRKTAPKLAAQLEAHNAAQEIVDPLPHDAGQEIGFDPADHPNCSSILWDNLTRNPQAVAVTGPAGTFTYGELIAEASRWGHAFGRFGCRPGERIAFLLDDTPALPAAFFGAVRAGYVPVLLNIQTPAETVRFFVEDSDARLAVTDADLLPLFSGEMLSATGLEQVVAVGAPGHEGEKQFLQGMPTALDVASTGPNDMAFWMYSSGSTGRPKGIVHLQHDMAFTQASYARHILGLTEEDRCFSVPKMYFAYGFGNSVTFPFSVGASSVLLPGQPRSDRVLDAIENYQPTALFGLPTLYTALAKSEGVDRRDLSSLRLSLSAAEVLSAEVYNAWKALVDHGPTEGLGSTEMLHIYLSNRPDDHRLGAAGAVVPGYDVRLVDAHGIPTGTAEGVMQVRGHSSLPSYWCRPDKTAATVRDDWVHTGDRFRCEDGHYYFLGREDDLVKVSGQWVWPLEVEHCLNEHPDVHEAAVLPHTLPDRRTVLRAIVHLRASAQQEGSDVALRDYVKGQLAPYKAPRLFEIVDALPHTGTGKIDRQALLVTAD
ncbi:MAG: benzoate-CoA ligase family protein [Paracoccaceae bacterium]